MAGAQGRNQVFGHAAAAAIYAGTESIDVELAGMISPAELAGLRAGPAGLGRIKQRTDPDEGPAAGNVLGIDRQPGLAGTEEREPS